MKLFLTLYGWAYVPLHILLIVWVLYPRRQEGRLDDFGRLVVGLFSMLLIFFFYIYARITCKC